MITDSGMSVIFSDRIGLASSWGMSVIFSEGIGLASSWPGMEKGGAAKLGGLRGLVLINEIPHSSPPAIACSHRLKLHHGSISVCRKLISTTLTKTTTKTLYNVQSGKTLVKDYRVRPLLHHHDTHRGHSAGRARAWSFVL